MRPATSRAHDRLAGGTSVTRDGLGNSPRRSSPTLVCSRSWRKRNKPIAPRWSSGRRSRLERERERNGHDFGLDPGIRLDGGVGQTIDFSGGALDLLDPQGFSGKIAGFASPDTVQLARDWTFSSFSETGNGMMGNLTLSSEGTTHAFHFLGDYTWRAISASPREPWERPRSLGTREAVGAPHGTGATAAVQTSQIAGRSPSAAQLSCAGDGGAKRRMGVTHLRASLSPGSWRQALSSKL